jgi:hypothetical protein
LAIGANKSATPVTRFKRCPPGIRDLGIGARAAFVSITQVWERLFIGGIYDAEALADPNPHAISTLVTLCPEILPEEVPGINHLYLPMLPDHALPVGMLNERIDELWKIVRLGTILIHSLDGANRAPILAAACRGLQNIDAALEKIGNLRSIELNPILLKSIKEHL